MRKAISVFILLFFCLGSSDAFGQSRRGVKPVPKKAQASQRVSSVKTARTAQAKPMLANSEKPIPLPRPE